MADDPNPRLAAYLAAARRGAKVRLLLDEFFAGLDQETSSVLAKYMQELNEQTIITTSHTPELINSFCNRSIHIRGGLIEKEEQL